MYTLGVAENFDFEGFHNVIADMVHVVLVDTMMLPPHAPPKLEP